MLKIEDLVKSRVPKAKTPAEMLALGKTDELLTRAQYSIK